MMPPESSGPPFQNRDAMFQDDWVGVILDTYGDASRAYELFVNPLGVQGDGLMTPQGEDMGFDVIPAVVGKQSGRRAVPEDPASSFETDRASISPSLNLRYDLTSSLAAEATINPDFSQVASDAARIDVNTTLALSFPERRPFFQEGSELLDTRIDAIYTRSINDPIAATKATRRGVTSAVYLGAVDESTPLLLPFQEHSAVVEAGRSVSKHSPRAP